MRFRDTRHLWLIANLLKRRLAERYRGSALGVSWAVLLPMLMLAVYTFFFRHLLGVRWPGDPAATDLEVALRIFLGLTFVNLAGEVLTSSTRLVLEQPAYIKKMQFPLPILAYVLVGAAFVQALLALGIAVIAGLLGGSGPPWAFPLILAYSIPLIIWLLAASWTLSALGVFLRDLQHILPPLVTVLLFLSPVFYTVSALPSEWHTLMSFNPLTLPIEAGRHLILGDPAPSSALWAIQFTGAALAAVGARWLFERVQPGFADAL